MESIIVYCLIFFNIFAINIITSLFKDYVRNCIFLFQVPILAAKDYKSVIIDPTLNYHHPLLKMTGSFNPSFCFEPADFRAFTGKFTAVAGLEPQRQWAV